MYDEAMVAPMRLELTQKGVLELKTPQQVEQFAQQPGNKVIFVNSVCGCAAGTARPGFLASLNHPQKPDRSATVFAGVDKEAVQAARALFGGYPPSSPCIAFFRGDRLVHLLERHSIEGTAPEILGQIIASVYNKFFGPQIDEAADILDALALLEITPSALQKKMDAGEEITFFDCREEEERSQAAGRDKVFFKKSRLITKAAADELIENAPKDKFLVFLSNQGQRSLQAVRFFRQYGFSNAYSLKGGLKAE